MTALAASLLKIALEFVYAKSAAFITGLVAGWIAKHQIVKRAKDGAQPMKDAKTGEEIDKATDSTLDHL